MTTQQIRPSKILSSLVWLSIVPTLIGEFFKIYHYPGASLLLTLGTFFLGFFYMPLYVLENLKSKQTNRQKIILLAQSSILFFFALGFIFKIMHWPGASVFFVVNNTILLVLVIPYALVQLYKSQKTSIDRSHAILIVMYFFCHSLGSLMNSSSGRIKINTVLQQGLSTEEALKAATSRNKQLDRSVNFVKGEADQDLFIKARKLQALTDSAIAHIQCLKSFVISKAETISLKQSDTLSCIQIHNAVDVDLPTEILIGNEFKPNNGKYSAQKLKSLITTFSDSLLNLALEQNRIIIKEGLNLNTDGYTDENGEPISWEMTHFYNMPVLYVINKFTDLQYEIKNAEYQVLTDIINSENKNLNTALANQISNLNAKFATIKKQEEISRLKGENEKGLLLLNAKDSELSDSRQTIIYFLMVILAFFVLVFFIIRSNYLRKITNAALKEQKEITELKKLEVEAQKHLVEEKQKEILESISYAKRLQEAILPPQDFINKHLPGTFIIYKPKDIVAGDFYWAEKVNNLFFIAAADSTGHGVPGAMVSLVCSSALNRSIKEFQLTETGKILDKTRELVVETFEKSSTDVKDGMDISLLCIDTVHKKIFWSGANNPLWYVTENEFVEIKADKQAIGKTDQPQPFTTHDIPYKKDSIFYLFTDGFADQFGGPKGKKFKYKQFSDLLLEHNTLHINEQSDIINKAFNHWKGDLEQVDDVCVIGLRL